MNKDLNTYLQEMTSFFKPPMCPIERLILEFGKDYIPKKRPKGIKKQQNRECFRNATNLVLDNSDLEYVEGYAIHDGLIPLQHAWTVNKQDEVVDPTWSNPELSEYRGVVISRDILIAEMLRTHFYGVLAPGEMINIKLIEELSGGKISFPRRKENA